MDLGALNFALSVGTSPRTIAARFGDILTPFDFNPTGLDLAGDSADAGPAFQAMYNAAFGSSASPHGPDAGYLNKPCYIPAGIYRTEQQLVMSHVDGGWVFGDGMDATKLVYHGAVDGSGPGGGAYTLYVRWARNCVFEGFTVSGPPAAAEPYTGAPVAFAVIGGTGALTGNAGNHNVFVNMGFERGVDGMFPGYVAGGLGSEFAFINCRVRNCRWGYRVATNNNALDHSLIGGSVENCSDGVSAIGGAFNIILGTRFSGNTDWDIDTSWGDPTTIIGIKSTSTCKNIQAGGAGTYVGNSEFASTDQFIYIIGAKAICDGNKIAGTVHGSGKVYLRGNAASHANLLTSWGGTTPENI